MRYLRAAALAACFITSACASDLGASISYGGCKGYNLLMPSATAAVRTDKLTVKQAAGVDYVRKTIGAQICESATPPTDEELIQLGIKTMVDGGVQALQLIVDSTKGK